MNQLYGAHRESIQYKEAFSPDENATQKYCQPVPRTHNPIITEQQQPRPWGPSHVL